MPGCRRNVPLITKSGSTLAVGSYYLVNVLPPGGIATGPMSGSTLFLQRGHGFQVGHKVMLYSLVHGTYTYLAGSGVQTVGDTFVVLAGAPPVIVNPVAAGDPIFNVGADGSAGASPSWNGNGTTIYSDIALTIPISNQQVAADVNGEATYHWSGRRVWEVYRNPDSGAIAAYELDVSAGGSVADAYGDTLPPTGDYPGQRFHLNAQGGAGSITHIWAEDSSGVFHWEVDVEVA